MNRRHLLLFAAPLALGATAANGSEPVEDDWEIDLGGADTPGMQIWAQRAPKSDDALHVFRLKYDRELATEDPKIKNLYFKIVGTRRQQPKLTVLVAHVDIECRIPKHRILLWVGRINAGRLSVDLKQANVLPDDGVFIGIA